MFLQSQALASHTIKAFVASKDAQELINDPAVVRRRTALLEEIANLSAALEDLRALPQQ
jgi:hypothetical protein